MQIAQKRQLQNCMFQHDHLYKDFKKDIHVNIHGKNKTIQ